MHYSKFKPHGIILNFSVAGIGMFLLFCFFCSCTVPEHEERKEIAIPKWEDKSPDEILDELKKQQARITNLTAHFSLTLHPAPEQGFSNLQGVLFFAKDREGNPLVRIKGLGPFGTTLFDMVNKGGKIEIFIPSKNTLYRGEPGGEMTSRKGWANSLMEMISDFSKTSVPRDAQAILTEDSVILPLTTGEIRLDRRNGLPRQWRKSDKIVSYSHYNDEPGMPPVPTRIEIRDLNTSHQASCTLSQLCVNCELGRVFDLSRYTPRHIRDISELPR